MIWLLSFIWQLELLHLYCTQGININTPHNYPGASIIIVKAMVFPVVMYGYESWTIKKVECQRTDAFELWCWRRLLRVPWTARKSNRSVLKEINTEYSLEGLLLKLQYFGLLIQRADSLEKTDAGKDWRQEEENRVAEDKMVTASQTQWTCIWANTGR